LPIFLNFKNFENKNPAAPARMLSLQPKQPEYICPGKAEYL